MQCSNDVLYSLHSSSNNSTLPFTIYPSLPSTPPQEVDTTNNYMFGCFCPLNALFAFYNTITKCIEVYDSKKLLKQIYIGHAKILGIDYDPQGFFYYYTKKQIICLHDLQPIYSTFHSSHSIQQIRWNHFFSEKNPYMDSTVAILFSNGTVQFLNPTLQTMMGMLNCPQTIFGIIFKYHLVITFGKQSICIFDLQTTTHFEITHYTTIVQCELFCKDYIVVLDVMHKLNIYQCCSGELMEQFSCDSFFIFEKESQLIHANTCQVLFSIPHSQTLEKQDHSLLTMLKQVAMHYPITFFFKTNSYHVQYVKKQIELTIQISNHKIQSISLFSVNQTCNKQQELLQIQFANYSKQHKSLEQQIGFVIYQMKQLFLKKISTTHNLTTIPSPKVSFASFAPNGTLVLIQNQSNQIIPPLKQYEEWKKKSSAVLPVIPLVHLYQTTSLLPFSYDLIHILKTPDKFHSVNQICLYNSQLVLPYSSTSAMIYQYLYHLLSFHPNHPLYYKTMQYMVDYVKQSRDVQLASMIGVVLQNQNSTLFYWSRKCYSELLHWWGFDCVATEMTPNSEVMERKKEFEIQVVVPQKNLICCKCHCRIKGLAMEMDGEWMHWKCK